MESQQRKPYVKPSIRDATPAEVERFHGARDDEREPDTSPSHEAPTFVCNGCGEELPGSELAPGDDPILGKLSDLCHDCAELLR